ncbi:MAG TPA: 16S rRNA (cytosine(967)-C(5))-methyltransferase RsmB [Gemmatimonadales bacterium]|nr:16S rRNA (cytosine(967)-C(5))-methyltransferase RsmB [Gemmatimonadales bacterium]
MSTKSRHTSGIPPRRAALTILAQVQEGRPFDQALEDAVRRLADPDRRLAHEISAGVLRRQRELDSSLARFIPRGWQAVSPALQNVLRIGAYQLSALDRVPPHAAVSTAVQLARETAGVRGAGFVNAVLRKVSSAPAPAGADEAAAVSLAERHSHPDWLVERWLQRFGAEETERLLRWNNTAPELVLQPARSSLDELEKRWTRAGIPVRPAPWGAGLVTDRSRPDELPGFDEGACFVQDPAQALLTWFADPPADASVADLCAAPGGKTLALGRLVHRLAAMEKHPRRAQRLVSNLARAGSGRETVLVGDALQPPLRPADLVLLDAPCLGTGTFARHPDARWRVSPDALRALAQHQERLLDAASTIVRPGGLLVYATCSLEPEENDQQVGAFLARHPEFRREPSSDFPAALTSPAGDLTVLPQRHGMDGAFAARLRRE